MVMTDKMQEAFFTACDLIAEMTGSCPLDSEGYMTRDCKTECTSDIDRSECWARYILQIGEK